MIKALQLGEKINHVYKIGDSFAVKQYISNERLKREITGMDQWAKLCSGTVPKKYLRFKDLVFFEFLNNIPKSVPTKLRVNNYLVEIYKEIYNNFSYHNNSGVYSYQNWENYLHSILDNLDDEYPILESKLNRREFKILKDTVDFIKEIDWKSYQKIPLHRDLHMGNIFLTKSGPRFIDFEHYCIGPIEFEFANSIFWNDDFSLDFKTILKKLDQEGILSDVTLCHKLVVVYFLEQMKIAHENKDNEKCDLLIKTFKSFVKRSIHTLRPKNCLHYYEL